ncbi:hypothetical protein TSOC_004348 [Tetrabaena socialis]|uniref:NHL repeat-containing protein 2 n=1 Tax=Tetrabaena socialis TaxID=47790 RepID=A0A2J8A908_9CHLO|nr:hypothetical protein TSOC_004348 [Tetrabaena socialis]|eukprot:PNH09016.1 hypothetical protein TSOC_004348 [Tetrabaena socialis]
MRGLVKLAQLEGEAAAEECNPPAPQKAAMSSGGGGGAGGRRSGGRLQGLASLLRPRPRGGGGGQQGAGAGGESNDDSTPRSDRSSAYSGRASTGSGLAAGPPAHPAPRPPAVSTLHIQIAPSEGVVGATHHRSSSSAALAALAAGAAGDGAGASGAGGAGAAAGAGGMLPGGDGLQAPVGVAVDYNGMAYIADTGHCRVLRVRLDTGEATVLAGGGGYGHRDGPGRKAKFACPMYLAIDPRDCSVVVTDQHCLRRVASDGFVTTIAGSTTPGHADGPAAQARFYNLRGVAVDSDGNAVLADSSNHCVRALSAADGMVSTLAGSAGNAGFRDAVGTEARFRNPCGVAFNLQVETLIELRAMSLERQGKMSRYGPLVVVESVKALLKMAAWSRYAGHMFLRHPTPDDLHQFESELGLQDILASLQRLHRKYTAAPAAGGQTPASAAAGAAACGGEPAAGCARPSACAGAGGRGLAAAAPGAPRAGVAPPAGPGSAPSGDGGDGGCQSAAGHSSGGGGRGGSGMPGVCGAQHERRCSGAACSPSPRCEAGVPGCAAPAGASRAGAALLWQWPSELHKQPPQGLQSQQHTPQPEGGPAPDRGRGPGVPLGGGGKGCGGAGGGGGGIAALRAAAAQAVEEGPDARMGHNLLWLAELLHIWRPVVYVTMLKRYGRRSWRPWLVSLAVDLLSAHFQARGRQHLAEAAAAAGAAAAAAMAEAGGVDLAREPGRVSGSGGAGVRNGTSRPPPGAGTSLLSLALARSLASPGVTVGEERELYERRRKLLLYALRSPFLEATTLSWLLAVRNATARVPLLGFAADYAYGVVDTFTAYYSYTSGSN